MDPYEQMRIQKLDAFETAKIASDGQRFATYESQVNNWRL